MGRRFRPADAQAAWAAASRMDRFGYGELQQACKISYDAAVRCIRGWQRQGLIAPAGLGKSRRKLWAVRPGATLPPPPENRQTPAWNMWKAMRGLRAFAPIDIAAHACTARVAVTEADAERYCRQLARAGYLRAVRQDGRAAYRLIRDTGPRPPRPCRVAAVWDPNSGDYAWTAAVGDAA
jgi:hypothetical protein